MPKRLMLMVFVEEIPEGNIRDFPIKFACVTVTALNVTKLRIDNVDPCEYMDRIADWKARVDSNGGAWRVVNDLERVEGLLQNQ